MRNNITFLIVLSTIILLIFLALEGIKIGDFQILSVEQLVAKNGELDDKIKEASKLTTEKYPANEKTLQDTYKAYKTQKQKYEELLGVSNEDNDEIYETKQYDIGYLWRVLGNYATKRGVNLGIQVQKNNTGKNSYNINFTVNGKYVNISQFITDIENNSDLYFRIYNFNLSGSGEVITATFTVRNINLDASTMS